MEYAKNLLRFIGYYSAVCTPFIIKYKHIENSPIVVGNVIMEEIAAL